MQMKVMVVSDRPNEYDGKKGHVKSHTFSVLDTEAGVDRFTQTFDYELSKDEKEAYAGKMQDKIIVLGVRGFRVFNGTLRADGRIVSTPLDKKAA